MDGRIFGLDNLDADAPALLRSLFEDRDGDLFRGHERGPIVKFHRS
jgi:hypothetical protein